MSNEFDYHLGKRLRAQRQLKGYTQQQVGEQLGVSFQQIQKYESGTNKISAERLHQFASFLGISPAMLLAEEAGTPAPTLQPTNPHDRLGLQLMRAFHLIRDGNRRHLLCQLAAALAGD